MIAGRQTGRMRSICLPQNPAINLSDGGHSAKRTATIPSGPPPCACTGRQLDPVHVWSVLNVTGCPERQCYLWLDEMAYEKAMVHFRRVLYRFLRVACKKMFSGHRIRRTTSANIVETTAIPKPTRSDAS